MAGAEERDAYLDHVTVQHDLPSGFKEEIRELGRWGTPPLCHRVRFMHAWHVLQIFEQDASPPDVSRKYRYFTKADIDSFFALFLDNLSSLLGILFAMVR
eukprot:2062554-Pleurochrysis_carterae.AAC.1